MTQELVGAGADPLWINPLFTFILGVKGILQFFHTIKKAPQSKTVMTTILFVAKGNKTKNYQIRDKKLDVRVIRQ